MPQLKGLVYRMILSKCENKKNAKNVDTLFDRLLEIGPNELAEDETQ